MIKEAVNHLKNHGYAILPDFMSVKACEAAVNQINRLITQFNPTEQQLLTFTTKNEETRQFDYFLQSGDKIRFFLEEKAYQNKKLVLPKLHSINKIGHAVHQFNNAFKSITFQKEIGEICKEIPINNPVVVQSMAILKPPLIGAQVQSHQDSTYLFDEPETLVGFWVPLQDATLENGCLWGIPGSHKRSLYSRSRMNWQKKHSYTDVIDKIDYKQEDFIPIPMKRGSLAFFMGRFVHKSNANTSNGSRYAYTWHLRSNDTKWAQDNWLQRKQFPKFQFNYQKQ